MAFPNWTNIPSFFAGKTIASYDAAGKDAFIMRFTDGSHCEFKAYVSRKRVGPSTETTTAEIVLNPSTP